MAESKRLTRNLWRLSALLWVATGVMYASLIWGGCETTGPADFVNDVAAFHSVGGC